MVVRELDIFRQCLEKPVYTGYMPTEIERDHSPSSKEKA